MGDLVLGLPGDHYVARAYTRSRRGGLVAARVVNEYEDELRLVACADGKLDESAAAP
jgi:hypothetical protein